MIKLIIILHLFVFQSMFLVKNIVLSKKLNINIRGKNKEASKSILLFFVTIIIAISSSLFENVNKIFIPFQITATLNNYFKTFGIFLLLLNLLISFLTLVQMRDSWRVGIKEGEKTELINNGIFKLSRNPYFLSYIIMFIAYNLLIANLILLFSSILSILSIHKMIIKEEKYLESLHGEKYIDYKNNVPRYFII